MNLNISGKNAFVTGGTRGLGLAAVRSLAREGVNVSYCARSTKSVERIDNELDSLKIKSFGVVSEINNNYSSLETLINTVEDKLGPIDILVNNVGGSLGSDSLINDDLINYENVFDINFWASLKLMKIVSSGMIQRRWGRIINIASIFGRELGGKSSSYMSSKASLIAATKHLAIETANTGITVNSIAPGSIKHDGGSWEKFVRTSESHEVDKFIEDNMPMGEFGKPEPVGDMVAFLSSKLAFTITGACINIDGGQSRSLF